MLAILGIAAWLVILGLLAITEISDTDLGRHVAYGRLLCQDFAAVGHTTFGQDPAVLTQAYSYWLYDILVFFLWDQTGPAAIVLLRAALLLCAFAWGVLIARRSGGSLPEIGLVLAVGIAMSQERFLDRPELFSFVAWIAAIHILMRRRDGRGIWLLVPLQILWVNIHLWFGLLPALVVMFAAGDWISRRGGLRRNLILVGALLIATFVNPAGPGAWRSQLYLVQFLSRNYSLPFAIQEMRSPFSSYEPSLAVWAFRVFMPLGIAIAVAGRRRIGWGAILALLLGAALAAKARRGIPLFGLAAIAILPAALTELVSRIRGRARETVEVALAGVVLAAGIVGVYALASGRFFLAKDQDTRFALDVSPNFPALDACRFIAREGIDGPVFSNASAAGALVLENGTRLPPFLDARWFGTPKTLADYQALRTATDQTIEGIWKGVDASHHFEAAVLDFYEMPALLRHLSADNNPDWATVYLDPTVAVLLRRDDRNQERIHRLEPAILLATAPRDPSRDKELSDTVIRFLESRRPSILRPLRFPYEPFYRANYALQVRRAYDAQVAYLALLKEERGSLHLSRHRVEILNNLFWCLLWTNEPAGIDAVATALRREPSTPPERRRMIAAEDARAMDALGRGPRAEEVAREILDDHSANAGERWAAWCRIASVRSKAEDFPAAADALQRAAEEKPGSAETYRSLGAILDFKLAKPAEALQAYLKFRSLAGSDPDVEERIRILEGK